jgi:hypothetical protein
MVDALRRAHRMVRPGGLVIDLHPTAEIAAVEVGTRSTGRIEGGDAPLRHAAAGAALATVLDEGLFAVDAAIDFTFYTYADTVDELRDYIADNWRNARIDETVVQRTRDVLRNVLGVRPRVREIVRLTKLHPIAPQDNPTSR